MAWRRPGDRPLSESMMVSLLMHICITRPQWVNVTSTSCQIPLKWIKKTPLMIGQHWCRLWLGAVRQQAITSAHIELHLRYVTCHVITWPQWVIFSLIQIWFKMVNSLWPRLRVASGQGKVREIFLFFKVREKSGNSMKSQGKSLDMGKSGKSQGIFYCLGAGNPAKWCHMGSSDDLWPDGAKP